MTVLLWPRMDGWLAAWWEPNRSSPYDVKWGQSPLQAIARLDMEDLT